MDLLYTQGARFYTRKSLCLINPSKQKTFGNDQIYVALSRAKNINGLYVSGKVEKSMIRANQDALGEYERLRKEVIFFKSSDIFNEIPNALWLLLYIKTYILFKGL